MPIPIERIDITYEQWKDGRTVEFDLPLKKRFLAKDMEENMLHRHRLEWRMDEPVLDLDAARNDEKRLIQFDMGFLAGEARNIKTDHPEPRVWLQLEAPQELMLERKGLELIVPVSVRLPKSNRLFAEVIYRVVLLRMPGNCNVAVDFGTSASCIAVKMGRGRRSADPQLQKLNRVKNRNPALFPSAMIILDEFDADFSESDKVDISLGGKRCSLGFGERVNDLGVTMDPSSVIPSLKHMIDSPSNYWSHFGITSPEGRSTAPSQLLSSYLRQLFRYMLNLNRSFWEGSTLPLVENLIVTVPNNASYYFIDRLKVAAQCAFNLCNSGGPPIEEWEVPPDKVLVIREAEAAAANYITRSRKRIDNVRPNQKRYIAVFDMGAGTCDAAVVRYDNVPRGKEFNYATTIEDRLGRYLGGNELDTLFARQIFQQLDIMAAKSLVTMGPDEKEILFGRATLNNDLIGQELESLGLFEAYSDLEQFRRFKENKAALDQFQRIRVGLKDYARRAKEQIADAFYGRTQQSADGTVTDLPHGVDTQALLEQCYDLCADGQGQNEGKIASRVREATEAFKQMEIQIEGSQFGSLILGGSLKISMRDLLQNSDFQCYMDRVTDQFVDDLLGDAILDKISESEDQALHVVLTGRLLAFPLIRERILLRLASKKVPRYVFPNRHFNLTDMKSAVVLGALGAKKKGLDMREYSDKVFTNYYLFHYDHEQNETEVNDRLISSDEDFPEKKGKKTALIKNSRPVYLREAEQGEDNLFILCMDKHDEEALNNIDDNTHKVQVVFDMPIQAVGDFRTQDQRLISLVAHPDGEVEVFVYPHTQNGRGLGEPLTYKLSQTDRSEENQEHRHKSFPI